MPFATTRMDLEIIIISKPNEDKYDITYMWNPKKKLTQMNLCTKQKQIHRRRKQTRLPQGKGKKGINQEFEINRYTLLI